MAKPYVNYSMAFALKPPDRLTVDDWVEQNIYLPSLTSSEPGPLRISRTPYTRGILRAFGALNIEHIVLVSGRQVGKSAGCLYPCLAYAIVQDPGPALFVISTKELAKYTSNNRLQPMFLHCEAVKQKLTSNPDDFATSEMRFQNMILSVVGGGSISQMISRPVRYLFRDEIDEIVGNISSSADPLKAVEETTSSFANRKIIDTSTPTTTTGNIWLQLKGCSYVFEFCVPCVYCGEKQLITWEKIKFNSEEKDKEKIITETYFECRACKKAIYEIQKEKMVQAGEWRARLNEDATEAILAGRDMDLGNSVLLDEALEDSNIRKIGFHLPKWYALFYNTTWGLAAKEFVEAIEINREYGDYTRLRDWSQFWAARPWVDKSEPKDVLDLLENRINIKALEVPEDYIVLTAGVDMAIDGFWFVVLAWRRDMSCHLVHWGFISGWESLTNLLWNTAYPVRGKEMSLDIFRLGIDIGGSAYGEGTMTMTEACYEWIRKHGRGKAFGIKGASHVIRGGKKMQMSVIDKMPNGRPIPGGLMNWLIDTDAFKDALHYKLSLIEEEAGRFTFPEEVDVEYINHLLSEEKRLNVRTGKYEWVTLRKANHLLDATIYAMAVADTECLGGVRVASMGKAIKKTEKREKTPIRRTWSVTEW